MITKEYLERYISNLPQGWKTAGGKEFVEELYNEVKDLEDYRVLQVFERLGTLRGYDYNGTFRTDEIISKYEKLSLHTCYRCGSISSSYTSGWLLPICDKCLEENLC